jgi:glycosyltransferase involved in cell wall biosynthesis
MRVLVTASAGFPGVADEIPGHQRARVMVIVPAYNEGPIIEATVRDLLSAGYEVIVVDDGSQDGTAAVRELPVVYIRHVVNLGQGAALETGMNYALRAGADIAIHFDADGQHDWRQIDRLLAPLLDGSADVVFGSRFLRKTDAARVPFQKRALLRTGILVSWLLTGVRLSDTHNGLRALSRRALERIHLQENGFAHATEILQRVREARLRLVEVPITVSYTDYSMRKGQPISNSINVLFDLILARMFR